MIYKGELKKKKLGWPSYVSIWVGRLEGMKPQQGFQLELCPDGLLKPS